MLIKAFRLFVSSTFADFVAERDVLQREVFPELDTYCTAKGYQFYPLDMRWGVNEEAQLDQRTAEICLGEVRAAKQEYPPPNFLILIGNRYGFVPLPYAIASDEFEAVLEWLEVRRKDDAADALRAVYQRDDNYLIRSGIAAASYFTSAYRLRSRADELPELKPAAAWAEREAELRVSLQEAADGLLAAGKINGAGHEKYFLSLTDQEIIAGVPGYRRFGDEASHPTPNADSPQAIAFIREIAVQSGSPPPIIAHYFEQQPRLNALKEGIRRALPADHIVTATANIDENGRISTTYLPDFSAQIQSKLKAAIDQYIGRVDAIERSPDYALTSERAAHRAFAERKREVFIGRERDLATVARYLVGADNHPLVLHGRSGFGKSAAMARAVAEAEALGKAAVIARFIGASAASPNLRALLVSLLEDLAGHDLVAKPPEFEPDPDKFSAQLAGLLSSITRPTVVFLDALDQLQKPRDLDWLPAELPSALKLVVSVLDDPAYEADRDLYRDLYNRLPPEAFHAIGPLGSPQGREMLSALEQQTSHRLQEDQRAYVIAKYDGAGGSPLYLRTAFEITRSWKSFHRPGTGRHVLADDTIGIIEQFIAELSSIHHHEPELVSRTLGFLAAAKDGLSAKELADVLSRDAAVMRAISSGDRGAATGKLPASVWVRLNRDLSPFLVEKQIDEQPLLQFFHRQVIQVARARYYDGCKTGLHGALADYFESQATERGGRRSYGKRALSELPYQLLHAENTPRLGDILVSVDWMLQKLAAFGPRPLIDDYRRVLHAGTNLTSEQAYWLRFWMTEGRVLHGALSFAECALCSENEFISSAMRATDLSEIRPLVPLALRTRRALPEQLISFETQYHTGDAIQLKSGHILCLPDLELWTIYGVPIGELPYAHAIELKNGRILAWSNDRAPKAHEWCSTTFQLYGAEGVRLGEAVSARHFMGEEQFEVHELPSGRILSGSSGGSWKLWNLHDDVLVPTNSTYRGKGIIELGDGHILSWSPVKIRCFDGEPVAGPFSQTETVLGTIALSNGNILVWPPLQLWSRDGKPLGLPWRGHIGTVLGAIELKSGRVVSWSEDNTLRFWSFDGEPIGGPVNAHQKHGLGGVIGLSSGRFISWSKVRGFQLWSRDGNPIGEQYTGRHSLDVHGAKELPSGRIIVWGNGGRQLWNANGELLRELKWDGEIELSDGRILSWRGKVLSLWELDEKRIPPQAGNIHSAGPLPLYGELPSGHIVSLNSGSFEDEGDLLAIWNADGQFIGEDPDGRFSIYPSDLQTHSQLQAFDGRAIGDPMWWVRQSRELRDYHFKGVIELSDGRILSWSDDALRLWGSDGKSIAVLLRFSESEDYERENIRGAIGLSGGRILAWSDGCLLLWTLDGKVIGHPMWETPEDSEEYLKGAIELSGGRMLAWSGDSLRLWSFDGKAIGPLIWERLDDSEGSLQGAIELSDGRILSWSYLALRLWSSEGKSIGNPLWKLPDNSREGLEGAIELSDGRILFWSEDALRLWSFDSKVVGHPVWERTPPRWGDLIKHDRLQGAIELSDGRMLSRHRGVPDTVRIWTAEGAPIGEAIPAEGAIELNNGRILTWTRGGVQIWSSEGRMPERHELWVGRVSLVTTSLKIVSDKGWYQVQIH
jgi:hypothetical protein